MRQDVNKKLLVGTKSGCASIMIDGDDTVPPHRADPTIVHMRISRLSKISNDESRCLFIDTRIYTNNIYWRKKEHIKERETNL